jgi:predicted RNase H-like HicB family nuclease
MKLYNLMKKMVQEFHIVIEKDAHGYFARCKDLEGYFAQGKTRKEVAQNIGVAIKFHLEEKTALDRELSRALEDVRKGRVHGPFPTAKKAIAFLHEAVKKEQRRRAKS